MEIIIKLNEEQFIELNPNKIIGIITDKEKEFLQIISAKYNKYELKINNQNITDINLSLYRKKIAIIKDYENKEYIKTVLDYMNHIIIKRNLMIKNPNKKIIESLKVVGLNDNYLLRNINTLSKSEKELINISANLLNNPDVIILTNQFHYLDLSNRKKLYRLLLKLKDQYKKMIILMDDDLNIINSFCDKCIYIKNNKKILDTDIKNFFANKEKIRRSKLEIPEIINLTYLAKETKKIKLDFHTDLRDIIKDIYKHV